MTFPTSGRAFVGCAGMLMAAAIACGADSPKSGQIKFEKKQLTNNLGEGCAIGDVNRDGKADVLAGPSWYEAPTWKAHPIRDMKPQGPDNEYFGTNGDHAFDVNGDGWVDMVTASWFSDKTFWYENPGKDGLAEGRNWKEHVISTGRSECEGTLMQDLDGDGVPELLLNRWNVKTPLTVIKIKPGKDGSEPSFKIFDIGDHGGHGMGVGDVNGDKRVDLLVSDGWYEAPEGSRLDGEWKFHKAFGMPPHMSLPFIVTDLTGDGKNDVIMGHAHDYGLVWLEQGPAKDGEITWTSHEIDKSFSQVHALAWEDIDGDGKKELLCGKRWRAHNDGDPGAKEPVCVMRFTWDRAKKTFQRDVISFDDGVGSGMQIRVADMDGDKKADVVVAGKTGTYILLNRGPAEARASR